MSGIYGFAAQRGIPDPKAMLNRMLNGLPSYGSVVEQQWVEPGGRAGLGAIHPTRIRQPGQFAQNPVSGLSCVFDGVVYRDTQGHGENLVEADGAALLFERFLESGTDCLTEISGSFNVAWWDGRAGRLVLANDKLGHRLLFFGLRAGRLVFASMLARVMAAAVLSPEMDPGGLADLLSYGHTLGERTLFKDVRILPPGSVLTYEGGELHVRQYWSVDQVEVHGRYDRRRLDELEDVFRTAVRRVIRPDLTCSIALTGGLDSRCVLAAAANQRLSFVAHTGGQPDSTDVVLARQVAARAGVQHRFGRLDPRKLGERLSPMVLHQGGILATLDSHPCGLFKSSPPVDAQVQAITGEIARGTWLSSEDLGVRGVAAVREALRERVSTKTARRLNLSQLWRPEFRHLGLRAREEHLDAVLSGCRVQDSALLLYDHFALYEHTRKILNKATLIVRAVMEDYSPYLDHQWLEAVLAIPVSERVTKRIQVDLIKRLYPSLVDIAHEKNLIPLSASPRRIGLTKQVRRIQRRLGRTFNWIGRPPVKVPCSHDWQWTREEMRPVLTELLYNPDAAFRAYLRWEAVEPLLDQHFSGQEEWKSLVAALVVFEIAQRMWVAA
jgi:asparagine synthase (glutamine-hydrolysing)